MYPYKTNNRQTFYPCSKRRSLFHIRKKRGKCQFLTDFDLIIKNIVTPDVIYSQWVQINRWTIHLITTLLKKNITIYCTRNTLKNGNLWGQSWHVSYIVLFHIFFLKPKSFFRNVIAKVKLLCVFLSFYIFYDCIMLCKIINHWLARNGENLKKKKYIK